MATDKLFTVVGVACKKGQYHVRWANDLTTRIKALQRDEQQDIRLIQLPEPMTKFEAVQMIIDHVDFQDDAAQMAIDDFLYSTGNKPQVKQIDTVVEPIVTYDDLVEDDLDSALTEAFAASTLIDEETIDEELVA